MDDRSLIKEIEKQIQIPLQKMSLDEMTEDRYKSIRGYTLDDVGHVIGLRLDRTDSKDNDIMDIAILKELKSLTTLYLRYNNITDYSFLQSLQSLTTLNLSGNNITDISFLQSLQSLTTLDLRSNNITDISYLQSLKSLTTLDLGYNNITDISNLKERKSLTTLDLRYNSITDISNLKALKTLTTLNLRGNNITDISNLKALKSLTTLNLRYNYITDISNLKALKTLTTLDLRDNNITDISNLKELKSITALDLRGNNITDVSNLKDMESLTTLDLCYNNITDISILKKLKSLTTLDLHGNNITDISVVSSLINLDVLNVDNNPVEIPPPEIVNEGLSAIRNYFKSIESSKETVRLYEAKLLVVGAGEAGKTCLMKRLMFPDKPVNQDELSTPGIDIQTWLIKIDNIQNFCINFWDFGGQAIMHSTHQFFLTKRSLYLFAWDSRRDENLTSFDYWLNVIRLLSDSSPVICVQNKIDRERPINVEQQSLQSEFNNIVSFERVSALEGTGIDLLTETIKKEMIQLPQIGSRLPREWVDIREELEGRKEEQYFYYRDYVKVCEKCGLDADQAGFLRDFYHDLGVILNFKDNNLLKDIVFLDPEWATRAVYLLVENKEIQANNGVFTYGELEEKYWRGLYPVKMYRQLLALMQKFELCFELDEESYVVPELLKSDKPEFGWSYQNNIRFICHYKFMPAGILTRFMARNHMLLEDGNYWKNGVVLRSNDSSGTKALMISERLQKKISIWVCGAGKKEMLEYIRNDIAQIHETLNNPNCSELIPCVCEECQSGPDPYLWDLNVLKKAIKKDVKKMRCNSSFIEVPIKRVLNNLVTPKDKITQFLQNNSIAITEHAGAFAGAFWRILNNNY